MQWQHKKKRRGEEIFNCELSTWRQIIKLLQVAQKCVKQIIIHDGLHDGQLKKQQLWSLAKFHVILF